MNVIIYNPNSFGGNYEYALQLLNAYNSKKEVCCKLIVPIASNSKNSFIKGILMNDVVNYPTFLKKLYFVLRVFLNPFIFWCYLLFQKKSNVIFNDFDQLSSFFWVPLFKVLRGRHKFSVILHDPDRDNYFSNIYLSRFSMRRVMSLMHYGLYHEVLPDKKYYKNEVVYFSIPHGLYEVDLTTDKRVDSLCQVLKSRGCFLMTIIGNIRTEKNYEAAIKSLGLNTKLHLIIAGKPANSSVDIRIYKALAEELGVSNQITWLTKYLSDKELNSIIKGVDLILLNYASTFTSQSGILNLIAPFSPAILVSKTNSALYHVCEKYNLGYTVSADNEVDFHAKILEVINDKTVVPDWKGYKQYASWDNNINFTIAKFNS